eukprot:1146872-Pelagomonas_calceolata.AAC.3
MAWSIVDEDPADMLRGTVGGLEDSKLAATCSCCCCCCILLANPASPPASLADATAEVAAPALVGVSVVALPPVWLGLCGAWAGDLPDFWCCK